jgi:hypothetical protein
MVDRPYRRKPTCRLGQAAATSPAAWLSIGTALLSDRELLGLGVQVAEFLCIGHCLVVEVPDEEASLPPAKATVLRRPGR